MPDTLKIAVDVMGGDHAPAAVVQGASLFLRESSDAAGVHLFLVGEPIATEQEVASCASDLLDRVTIVPTSQTIEMHESPLEALRKKPDSSIAVCARMVRDEAAAATISAGNTGACMVAAIQTMDRIAGVGRPAIATSLPTERNGLSLLVDAGANVDCRPSQLATFALLGAIYAERVLGITRPRVGLLSNGEEESKGNELVKETRALLTAGRLNFVGNVEGNHITEGEADVIVCDGFVGNVLLKTAEGMGRLALTLLASEARHRTDDMERRVLQEAYEVVRKHLDYSEYGGAPLLGVNGVSIIAHGRSDARAIASAIRTAAQAARAGFVDAVRQALELGRVDE